MGKKYLKECKGGEDCRNERHLCKIAGTNDDELIRTLVKEARYFCRKCGRSAHNETNLCKPIEI